jgi:hypothetical protein
MTIHLKRQRNTDETQDEYMLICGMHKQQRRQQTKQRQFKTIWVVVVYKKSMLTLTGVITPVSVNELIPRECFCMLYTQRVNLFGMRAVLCQLPATYTLYHDV